MNKNEDNSIVNRVVLLKPVWLKNDEIRSVFESEKILRSEAEYECVVIYDQGFKEEDYEYRRRKNPNVNYVFIGHEPGPVGFTKPRVALLKWFYSSDFDYATLIDALNYLRHDDNNVSTFRHWIRHETRFKVNYVAFDYEAFPVEDRTLIKQHKDYPNNFFLQYFPAFVPKKKFIPDLYNFCLTAFTMLNYKKYYGIELNLPEDFEGKGEDVYLRNIITRCFDGFLAPACTVVVHDAKFSTYANKNSEYTYKKDPAWQKQYESQVKKLLLDPNYLSLCDKYRKTQWPQIQNFVEKDERSKIEKYYLKIPRLHDNGRIPMYKPRHRKPKNTTENTTKNADTASKA